MKGISMLSGCISWVKAAQDFFSEDGGRKIEVSEFKALTTQDRAELHSMLAEHGYELDALATATA